MHPVLDGPELQGYDRTQGHIRSHDHACLMDEELRGMIEAAGARRISFRPLRDLIRKRVHAVDGRE